MVGRTAPPPGQRLHALDNLRAAMMWLGIVLHVAANHLTGPSPLPWRDRDTTAWADLITAFIHAFRMPVFFLVAGFFVALLVQRRGARGMLRHRFQRLALPFLLFWPLLFVSVGLAALLYWGVMVNGRLGLDLSLVPQIQAAVPDKPQINTLHLWFLYQLWWFVVIAAVLSVVPLQPLARLGERLGAAWWGLPVLALPLAWVGASYPDGIVLPRGSFLPPLAEWLHNGLFFAFGAVLHAARDSLLPLYQRRCGLLLLAGVPFFVAAGALHAAGQRDGSIPHLAAAIAFTYNAATWCWSLGLIGLFLRWLPSRHPVLAYLADSSYAVYLVHMVGTIGFGALVYGWPVGAGWKMAANVLMTTAASLLVYQVLVRGTWVGRLLGEGSVPHRGDGARRD